MSQVPSPGAKLSDIVESNIVEYRPVSRAAVASLLFGLASAAALASLLLLFVPVIGVLVGAVALRKLAAAGASMSGRTLALAGLGLSILFGTAAPVQVSTYRTWMNQEARPVGQQWFAYLREQEPQKALQLTFRPAMRRPLDDNLWHYYTNSMSAYQEIEKFVKHPLVRALLELKENADVRFYEAGMVEGDDDRVVQTYAVTYDENGKKKTFFVNLILERTPPAQNGAGNWRVVSFAGGIRPRSMAEYGR